MGLSEWTWGPKLTRRDTVGPIEAKEQFAWPLIQTSLQDPFKFMSSENNGWRMTFPSCLLLCGRALIC
jgi:hypothetical protein